MNHLQGSRYFKQQFLLAMVQYKRILLDLEELTFFDSLSVSVVLNMNKLIKETGGAMRMCGANYIVSELFTTLNISQIIPLYNVVTDALDDWL
jgi:anti-anti-sigma factor